MTEDEAKTKWCPHVGLPRYTRQQEECIGSACMAWQWVNEWGADPRSIIRWPDTEDETVLRESEPCRPTDLPASYVWVPMTGDGDDCVGGFWQETEAEHAARVAKIRAKRPGYCGAFGKAGGFIE